MYRLIIPLFFVLAPLTCLNAQTSSNRSPLDATKWGVVYDVAATRKVTVRHNVMYLKDGASELAIDIYSPPDMQGGRMLPAVVFLNAIGDTPSGKVKDWEIYRSWPRLVAAHGMIGISMDADANRVQESLKSLFVFLRKDGAAYGIDADRLGVYAASANTTQSLIFLMGPEAPKGIRAAALYYGSAPQPDTVVRKDLPVLFVLAEGDLQGFGQSSLGLWQRVAESSAPWTLVFAANLLHAFDAFQDSDESRRIIQQTIEFWRSHLEPVPQPPWERSTARAIVASTYGSDNQVTADLLAKYIAENPNDAQAYVMLGRALSQLRKYEESATAFEKAASLRPDHPMIPAGLGQVRFAQRRYKEAEALLQKAIENGFRNSLVYGQLGFSELVLNKNEEAISSYEKAFEAGIPPGATTRGIAYYNMACAYARLKNNDMAFEMLEKAVNEGYGNRDALMNDSDLAPLRTDARFEKLLERLRKPAASN